MVCMYAITADEQSDLEEEYLEGNINGVCEEELDDDFARQMDEFASCSD